MNAEKLAQGPVELRLKRIDSLPMRQAGQPQRFRSDFRELFERRNLLALLVRRDLKARYKDSALGFVWALVRPLTQLLISFIVVGQFLGAAKGIPNFAIYVFSGLTVYTLFSEIVGVGTASVVSNGGLIKKVFFPRLILPLAAVGSSLFFFLIQLALLAIATLLTNRGFEIPGVIFVLPGTILIAVFATALAIVLSAANVYLRDIQYLVEVGLMLAMWASPIMYSWTMVRRILGDSIWLDIYTNNPVTLSVLAFQRAFWESPSHELAAPADLLARLGWAIGICTISVVGAAIVFRRSQGNFAQML